MTSTVIEPTTTRRPRATAFLTLAAGSLFVLVPLLVEFVSGDAFVLMGVAGLLVLLALPGLRRLQHGADGREPLELREKCPQKEPLPLHRRHRVNRAPCTARNAKQIGKLWTCLPGALEGVRPYRPSGPRKRKAKA